MRLALKSVSRRYFLSLSLRKLSRSGESNTCRGMRGLTPKRSHSPAIGPLVERVSEEGEPCSYLSHDTSAGRAQDHRLPPTPKAPCFCDEPTPKRINKEKKKETPRDHISPLFPALLRRRSPLYNLIPIISVLVACEKCLHGHQRFTRPS